MQHDIRIAITKQIPDQMLKFSITNLKQLNNQRNGVLCEATISYQHQLYPQAPLSIKYNFNLNHSAHLTRLDFASKQQQDKFKRWLQQIPTIINYQKTKLGTLMVIQAKAQNHNQHLIFGQRCLALGNIDSYSSITIDKRFVLDHHDVFLVSAYLNQKQDQQINHSYLVDIESAGQIMLSESFSYQEQSLKQIANSLIFNGNSQYAFAESTDYPIYKYESMTLNLIQASKPLDYYRHKFAKFSAEQILSQIKNDGCLNGDQFYLSTLCNSNQASYCFQFESIQPKPKTKAYWRLKQLCNPALFSN